MSRKETKEQLQKAFEDINLDVEGSALETVLDILAVQMEVNAEQNRVLNQEYQAVLSEKTIQIQLLKNTLKEMKLTLNDALSKRHRQYVTEVRRLKAKNMEVSKLLGQIHHDLSTRKKKLRIADYETVLNNIVDRINAIMPKQARKKLRDQEEIERTKKAFSEITTFLNN